MSDERTRERRLRAGKGRAQGTPLPRRRVLALLGGVCGAAALGSGTLGLLSGCAGPRSGSEEGPDLPVLRIPLAELPPGERRTVTLGTLPAEVRRTETGVEARSLRCTHFGCTVAWMTAEEIYECPCHDGRFAADGRVLGGPPSRPLPELPARIEGDEVVVELPPELAGIAAGPDGEGEGS